MLKLNSNKFFSDPDQVDHHTPESHWCGACMHWVVDCDHLANPLPIAHRKVEDGWIRSLAYDRVRGRLEVDYKWNSVRQYSPISPQRFRELWNARPMHLTLSTMIDSRRVREDYVRTEGKVLVTLLKGWELVVA